MKRRTAKPSKARKAGIWSARYKEGSKWVTFSLAYLVLGPVCIYTKHLGSIPSVSLLKFTRVFRAACVFASLASRFKAQICCAGARVCRAESVCAGMVISRRNQLKHKRGIILCGCVIKSARGSVGRYNDKIFSRYCSRRALSVWKKFIWKISFSARAKKQRREYFFIMRIISSVRRANGRVTNGWSCGINNTAGRTVANSVLRFARAPIFCLMKNVGSKVARAWEISWSISRCMRGLDNSVKWRGRYRLQSRTSVLLQAIAVALQSVENPLQLTWLFNDALVVCPQCLFAVRSLPVLCALLCTRVHV